MRKKVLVFLLIMGVSALGVRLILSKKAISQDPSGQEIQLVKYDRFNQLSISNSPLDHLQSALDSISEAAKQEKWNSASRAMQQLNDAWQPLQKSDSNYLASEEKINVLLQTLNYNVWAKDQKEVLSTAHKLTLLINQLTR